MAGSFAVTQHSDGFFTCHAHGTLLRRKAASNSVLSLGLANYETFAAAATNLKVTDQAGVDALVAAFNVYREAVIYAFETGRNVPQENLRSTMMEEFLGWLFKDLFDILDADRPKNFFMGKSVGSYLALTFAPQRFSSLFFDPNPKIGKKDQDFVIGSVMKLEIGPTGDSKPTFSEAITLPVVAIECKTYLARNHLDMCSSTAQSLKRANPYCMYLIAAEFLKMDAGVTPEVTDIAEIFLLCKAHNSERRARKESGLPPHVIHPDVVWDFFAWCLVI